MGPETAAVVAAAPQAALEVDGVRKKRGVWNVPTFGILSFVHLGCSFPGTPPTCA